MKRRKREGERERRGTKVEKERRERARREKETNEYEGGRYAYRGDSGPEPRLYIILTPYQVYITPRHMGASSSTTQSPPAARRTSFRKLRHQVSLGDAIASPLAAIPPVGCSEGVRRYSL